MIPRIERAAQILNDAIVAHDGMPGYCTLEAISFGLDEDKVLTDDDGTDEDFSIRGDWWYNFLVAHSHGSQIDEIHRDVTHERVGIIREFLQEVDLRWREYDAGARKLVQGLRESNDALTEANNALTGTNANLMEAITAYAQEQISYKAEIDFLRELNESQREALADIKDVPVESVLFPENLPVQAEAPQEESFTFNSTEGSAVVLPTSVFALPADYVPAIVPGLQPLTRPQYKTGDEWLDKTRK